MGCEVRLIVGGPASGSRDPDGTASAAAVRKLIAEFESRLSRFLPESDLNRLNAHPSGQVPCPPLARALVGAAIWAAGESDGLLDPTLVDRLGEVGYSESLEGATPAPLADALAAAPPRRPAHPDRTSKWRGIVVDEEAGTVTRPRGTLIDSGGVGKGLAADAAAELLGDRSRFCISLGGDLRAGGPDAVSSPIPISIEDPFGGDPVATVALTGGALATSGIGKRIWQRPDGSFAHHLLDPSTGEPAWTGLLQVTALAATALEAETLSKRVLLGGPSSVHLLERRGGVVIHDDCRVELIGPLAAAGRAPRRARAAA